MAPIPWRLSLFIDEAMTPSIAIPQPSRFQRLSLVAAIGLLASSLPWLIEYTLRLARLHHFSHAPWALAGLIVLLIRRLDRVDPWLPDSVVRSRLRIAGLLIFCSSLIGACLTRSPWLVACGSVVLVGAMLAQLKDNASKQSLAYLTLLLAALIRPPLNLDLSLQKLLQTGSCRFVSFAFDLCGLLSLSSGDSLRVPRMSWLVAEECSGIQSVFALSFASVAIGVWRRAGLLSVAISLILAILFALLGNALRIIVVVMCGEAWGEGWRHELVGSATLVSSVLLLLIANRECLVSACRRWAASSKPPPNTAPASPSLSSHKHSSPRSRFPETLAIILACLTAGTAPAISWNRPLYELDSISQQSFSAPEQWLDGLVSENALAWDVLRHQRETRDRQSAWGRWSEHWHLNASGTNQPVVASIDYPFTGWHEVLNCYEGGGWEVEERRIVVDRVRDRSWVEAKLTRGSERARLYFGLIDDSGEWLEPPETMSLSRWSLASLYRRFQRASDRTTFQWQLWAPLERTRSDDLSALWQSILDRASAQQAEYRPASAVSAH